MHPTFGVLDHICYIVFLLFGIEIDKCLDTLQIQLLGIYGHRSGTGYSHWFQDIRRRGNISSHDLARNISHALDKNGPIAKLQDYDLRFCARSTVSYVPCPRLMLSYIGTSYTVRKYVWTLLHRHMDIA